MVKLMMTPTIPKRNVVNETYPKDFLKFPSTSKSLVYSYFLV